MDDDALIRAITVEVLRQIGLCPGVCPDRAGVGQGPTPPRIPVGVSARHCHLCPEHLAALFGPGRELTVRAPLYQPGNFAAEESVTLVGPRGVLQNVRVLGPLRPRSQVEVSLTDAIALGVRPPVSDGSDPRDSAPVVLVGPAGAVNLREGLIVAWRHIHLGPRDAELWGVKDGERVSVEFPGDRGLIMKNVIVRVGPDSIPHVHIDTDEANAAGIAGPTEVVIVGKCESCESCSRLGGASDLPVPGGVGLEASSREHRLARTVVTADDVRAASEAGQRRIFAAAGSQVTDLARDAAKRLGVRIEFG